MMAVFEKELRAYFHGVTGFVFSAFLLLFVGIYMMVGCLYGLSPHFEYVLGSTTFIFLIGIPLLTMRSVAEEKRLKTDQLLYSLPISTTEVVLGKYLALLLVYLLPLCIISLYPLFFSQFGDVYLPTSYGSIFAFFLLGAALIAVGVFISSLTDNQGFAAGIGIAVILFNYYSVSLSEYVSSSALGSLIALCVIIFALALIIRYVTRSDSIWSSMKSPWRT